MPTQHFCITQDEDARWFVIPVDRGDEFDEWVNSGAHQIPAWAYPIVCPEVVRFPEFVVAEGVDGSA